MKKLLWIIAALVCFTYALSPAATVATNNLAPGMQKVDVYWTGSTNGITNAISVGMFGTVRAVNVEPAKSQINATFSISIVDVDGFDLLGGLGLLNAYTTTNTFLPASPAFGSYNLVVTGVSSNETSGKIHLFLR